MNPNYSISIMQFLKLVGLSSILKTSCSIREELLPGLMGYTHLAVYTPSRIICAPRGLKKGRHRRQIVIVLKRKLLNNERPP